MLLCKKYVSLHRCFQYVLWTIRKIFSVMSKNKKLIEQGGFGKKKKKKKNSNNYRS
jgi:hypothetical protein